MKQRLVGALVLVSGGVVLWSILFTGPAAYKVDRNTQIPPAPEMEEPAPVAPQRPSHIAEVEPEKPLPEPPVPDIAAASVGEPEEPAPEPEPKAEEPPQPAAKAPIVNDSTGVANAWIVQVASFSNESNAKKLKERLQAKGYKAYVKAAPTKSGKVLQRVFVGPELKKAVAERQKKEIEEAFKLKALLHEFEP
ncbi:DedD protein [Litorivivens lipolytica]|uniref:DedD protein n=1 Tax=Litorivivens lipolytica TaxID=1524264 RepID=A0A7W4W3J7_9GAMM|nr:SPOR domain-containing protein [Litorivivens lipolytica]MBB3046257.1 DedD protein [Litorivivens lipolytica]